MILPTISFAHEMTPTYPEFKGSYVGDILTTRMRLFNQRSDVEYYEIDVYDAEWNNMPFATERKIIYVKYLNTEYFDVYIRESDKERIEYICSTSKLQKNESVTTAISSRICSRIR